jgi:hypothetical protein
MIWSVSGILVVSSYLKYIMNLFSKNVNMRKGCDIGELVITWIYCTCLNPLSWKQNKQQISEVLLNTTVIPAGMQTSYGLSRTRTVQNQILLKKANYGTEVYICFLLTT